MKTKNLGNLQAGNVGVLQGAEKFDRTRGYKFSTYVQYWIKKSLLMLLSRHAREIRIPVCCCFLPESVNSYMLFTLFLHLKF